MRGVRMQCLKTISGKPIRQENTQLTHSIEFSHLQT